jgi:Ca2+/Na+ antiporter
MPTGLVYVAILVLWAVVLVPMWLRRHERTAEHRTTRRFRHAMATLDRSRLTRRPVDVMLVSRSGQRGGIDAPTTLASSLVLDASVDLHLDHGVDPFVDTVEEHEVLLARRADSRRVAVRIAAARRRRTLAALLAATLVVGVLGLLGIIAMWVAVVPVLAAVGFLVLARAQVRSQVAQDSRWARRMAARRSASPTGLPLATVIPVRRHLEASAVSDGEVERSRSTSAGTIDSAGQVRTVGATSPGADDVRVLSPAEVAELRSGAVSAAAAVRGSLHPGTSRYSGVRGVVSEGGRGFFTVAGRRPAVVAGSGGRVTTPGSLSGARLMEQTAAISATHTDVEQELGLDEYAYPERSDAVLPRAAGE